jgi:hypothetical protein
MRADRQLLADTIKIQIDALAPSHCLTLAFNNGHVPAGQAARTLRHLAAMLDRRLLGPRYTAKPALRTKLLLVPEDEAGNTHFHGVAKIHPDLLEKFEGLLSESTDPRTGEIIQTLPLWLAIYRPGSSCVRTYSSSGWGDYMTKSITEQTFENTVYL